MKLISGTSLMKFLRGKSYNCIERAAEFLHESDHPGSLFLWITTTLDIS
jgi:hypothetical protein